MEVELSAEQMMAEVSKDAEKPAAEAGAAPASAGVTDSLSSKEVEQMLGLDKYGKHFVEYKANGKPVKETLEQALNRSSQGYNYAQLLAEFKQKEPTYQKQIEELNAKIQGLSKWEQFDKYATENQAWGKHVDEMWKNKEQFSNPDLDPNDPLTKKLAQLEQMVSNFSNQFGEKFNKYDSLVKTQEEKQEDAAFSKEIEAAKSHFKDVDFDTKDESGKSTATYVMEHMVRAKIPSFKTAFLDLYHDQLLAAKEQAIRDQHAKEVQKRTKQGIIDITSTPNGKDKNAPISNIGSKSWDDLALIAKKDYGYA